jgi:transposase
MLDWEQYQKIRRMYLVEGLSQRVIAQKLHVSRKTIRKYCKGGALPNMHQPNERGPSVLRAAVEGEILNILKENPLLPKKQRMSGTDICKYLVNEKGYSIGETTVRQYIRELKGLNPEIFLPLEYEPGETMEFDWGDMVAYIGETRTQTSVFCSALPHSGAIFAGVYPDKSSLCFSHAHVKAFEFFGGVAPRCIYDNLKTAVLKGSGKNAVKQESFKRLEAHYGFEGVFCNRAAGWEKGAVENAVAIVRSIAFTPIPHVESFDELQEHVINKCIEYCRNHRIKGREQSIWDMLANEKKRLFPLPQMPYDAELTVLATVYPDLTVQYENIRYSLPKEVAGHKVTLKISPFNITAYYQGSEIYRHWKALRSNDHQYVLEHYLEILERKPRALPNAIPIKKGIMPEELKEFSRLYRGSDREKQMVDILLLGRKIDKERLLWALQQANSTKNPSYRLVCFFLDIGNHSADSSDIEIQHKALEEYDKKLQGGISNDYTVT